MTSLRQGRFLRLLRHLLTVYCVAAASILTLAIFWIWFDSNQNDKTSQDRVRFSIGTYLMDETHTQRGPLFEQAVLSMGNPANRITKDQLLRTLGRPDYETRNVKGEVLAAYMYRVEAQEKAAIISMRNDIIEKVGISDKPSEVKALFQPD